jgi:hypothetical protein
MQEFVRFDRINASCLLFPSSLHNQIIQINSFIFNVFYYASDFRVFFATYYNFAMCVNKP